MGSNDILQIQEEVDRAKEDQVKRENRRGVLRAIDGLALLTIVLAGLLAVFLWWFFLR